MATAIYVFCGETAYAEITAAIGVGHSAVAPLSGAQIKLLKTLGASDVVCRYDDGMEQKTTAQTILEGSIAEVDPGGTNDDDK